MPRVVVKAVPAGGFWEAGQFWPANQDTTADVTPEQLALMKATPHLVVVEIPGSASTPSEDTPAEAPKSRKRS